MSNGMSCLIATVTIFSILKWLFTCLICPFQLNHFIAFSFKKILWDTMLLLRYLKHYGILKYDWNNFNDHAFQIFYSHQLSFISLSLKILIHSQGRWYNPDIIGRKSFCLDLLHCFADFVMKSCTLITCYYA